MPGRLNAPRASALLVVLLAGLLVPVGLVATAPAAQAAARVSIANPDGDAVVDPTYATTLTVRGSGFQSIEGGHGGVYVFFGTVGSGWQPSGGGRTGVDYFYVPDSESADNQGFQKYVAFPGSDTASSANGGLMDSDGSWSTTVTVPGAVFTAYDRSSNERTVDCREVTCGIITVGAHGVANSSNETFTPVRVADLYDEDDAPAESGAGTASGATPTTAAPGATGSSGTAPAAEAPVAAGPATLEVDRAGAVAGRVLPFRATGLPAGQQLSVTFDDGAAAAGPFQVAADGTMAGVVSIPVDTSAGTHELRVFGLEEELAVRFAVQADGSAADDSDATEAVAASAGAPSRYAVAFVVAAGLVVLAAVARLLLARRRAVLR
ncbi:hypothetical protein QE364_000495 [Nocardioides zeae]|uniref:Uncharacterized protein n=2 Tax=Nocardioides zeae TaxID=1457234 RepID=A0AAJ1U1Y4_9ACTN|nr:hypothetical protein [Nocardioides zeae]MDQ1104430.1 hypothetical protein [Nocardioides zeae]MDR6175879.1 hypothetical protein [Nocardioides zeae]MDR6208807.1 hypothetical protein [Nocardioides zeae]